MNYLTHTKDRRKTEHYLVVGISGTFIMFALLFCFYGCSLLSVNQNEASSLEDVEVVTRKINHSSESDLILYRLNTYPNKDFTLFDNDSLVLNTEYTMVKELITVEEEIEEEIIRHFENDYLNTLHDEIFAIGVFEDYNSDIVSRDLYLLLQIVHAESGNQPTEGRSAVAEVIFNRINSDSIDFKNLHTVEQVIMVKGQFTPVSSGTIYQVSVDDITFEAVKVALTNSSYANGAHFFYNPSIVKSSWFQSLELKSEIADHQFKG